MIQISFEPNSNILKNLEKYEVVRMSQDIFSPSKIRTQNTDGPMKTIIYRRKPS